MAAAAEGDAEDDGGGSPGIWGTWGPWSACSRSCSGGVKEQTRPCLPGSARTPARAFTGRVLSAVRTSVPLHRSRQELRAAPSSDAAGVQGPASLRGSRHSQARGGGTPTERRYAPLTPSVLHACPHAPVSAVSLACAAPPRVPVCMPGIAAPAPTTLAFVWLLRLSCAPWALPPSLFTHPFLLGCLSGMWENSCPG